MSAPGKLDAYGQAGVDYAAIDPGKLLAQRAALRTAPQLHRHGFKELPQSRGESAYVIDLGDRYLATVTEALGTKNLVADAVRAITGRTHYDAIAKDTVATILNDLCTLGGAPLCLTAYWGAGSTDWFADVERMRDLTEGWAAACEEAHCAWGGGETQVLVGAIEKNAMVLGGSAVGQIAKDRLISDVDLRPGDAILVAAASGIHANGLTLAREVARSLPGGYATPVPGDPAGRGFGEVLLDPTPLYGPLVEALQQAGIALHYTVHVTGHGWRKLMRAQRDLRYVVEQLPPVPKVFDLIASSAKIDRDEAYATFNMGAGFAFFVAQADVPAAQAAAAALGQPLLEIGHIEAGAKAVELRPLGVTLAGDSLQIR